jgi:hypothetical protein
LRSLERGRGQPARRRLERAPEVNSDVGALLGHLNAVPFLGSVEIRDGPIGMFGGAIHLPVGTDITTRNVFFNGGNAGLVAGAGTALLLYRALDIPGQYADLGVGFRAWGFSANVSLNPGFCRERASIVRPAGSIR